MIATNEAPVNTGGSVGGPPAGTKHVCHRTMSGFVVARWLASLSAMSDKVTVTKTAFERMKAEHEDLTTRGMLDIARKIEAARELGDLSENGDYHAAKEEQGKQHGRILHLEHFLENCEIGDVPVVTIRYEGDDEPERYLLGSIEERVEGLEVMSPGSPLGAALGKAKAGETVSYSTPNGNTLQVEVLDVTHLDGSAS
ncbi:MAG: transcription elongation factor GreA [Acidimicrobiales bacterium]|nr:transcription elongation factor GreA [Acidimicrobiales bacterium]